MRRCSCTLEFVNVSTLLLLPFFLPWYWTCAAMSAVLNGSMEGRQSHSMYLEQIPSLRKCTILSHPKVTHHKV